MSNHTIKYVDNETDVLLYHWQIKLMRDNKVLEKTGSCGSISDYKINKFTDTTSARDYYLQKIHLKINDPEFKKLDGDLIGISVIDKNIEPNLKLAEYFTDPSFVIDYLQAENPRHKIHDLDCIESTYLIKAADTEGSTIRLLTGLLLKHGEAEILIMG